MSADRIELRGLQLVGVVGVLPEERERPQPLRIDIDIELDVSASAATDALEDTVNYGDACDRVERIVDSARPQLLERLAVLIAQDLLSMDPMISAARVTVSKLRPPVPHQLDTSGVSVRRARS